MKRHQLHVRITASEYQFLTDAAHSSEETIATLVRRLIRAAIRARDRISSPGANPPVAAYTENGYTTTPRADRTFNRQ